jgi:hypothetical protein
MEYVEVLVRIYLFLFSIYHITTGIVSFFFPNFAKTFYLKLYDFHYELTPELFLVSKPWGALCISTGIATIFACINPFMYHGVIYALIVLLLLRAVYRYRYRFMMKEVINTDITRNYINIIIIIFGICILSVWSLLLLCYYR